MSDGIRLDPQGRKIFEPDGVTLTAFLMDRSPVSIIRGAIGSGTSSACCMKLWQMACEQKAGLDGMRRTRFCIIRNSYPELETTTVKTWLFWFEERIYGELRRSKPMLHHIRVGNVDMEVVFLALDDEDAIRKLRSLELTGVWFNELEYIPKAIFDEALSRCGRYPAKAVSPATWYGVIADLNAPNEDHWLPKLMGEVPPPPDADPDDMAEYTRPKGWCYLVQPPALIEEFGDDGKTVVGYRLNPKAENVRWLVDGFYQGQVQGKSRTWIESRLMNRITMHVDGKKVFPEFVPETHVSKQPLRVVPGHPVYVGLDFGRNPAAVFAQFVGNRWYVQHELIGRDVGTTTFAPQVKKKLEKEYPGCRVSVWGDPKGRDKTQNDERTAYEIYRGHGITVQAAPVKNNAIETRLEAVRYVLTGLSDGQPRLLVSQTCVRLKMAMAGAYHYRKIKGSNRYEDAPFKDTAADVADALQYLILGGGEGRAMLFGGGSAIPRPVKLGGRKSSRRFVAA